MTVSTLINRVVYTGNGSATAFAVPFKVLDEDHLVVKRRVIATNTIDKTYIGTEYSYSGIGASSGILTLAGPALSSSYKLEIERIVPYTQELDIVNSGGFYPETVEEQLDLMVMGIQQIGAQADDIETRALMVPEGEVAPTYAEFLSYFKGDPGGNVESVGTFVSLSSGAIEIPLGTDTIQTSGYSVAGIGAARYVTDVAVNGAYVTANPLSSFIDAGGRGWRLDVSDGDVHVDQLGALGDATLSGGVYSGTDDTAAFRAAIALGDRIEAAGRAYMLHDIENVLTLTSKELRGCGVSETKLCKKPLAVSETQLGARSFILNTGGMVRDLSIYVQKSGVGRGASQRMNGILYTGTNPRAENVDVYDCTGYGHFVGSATGGHANNVEATNCDVLFEPINSTDFTFDGFRWHEGDNDCGANTVMEVYRNVSPTDNIIFRNGSGDHMTTASLVAIGLTNGPLSNLTFDNVRAITDANINSFSVAGGAVGRKLTGLNVINSSFESTTANGASIDHVDGAKFIGTDFIGDSIGINIDPNCTKIQAIGSYARGTLLYGVVSGSPNSEVTWDGTLIGGLAGAGGTLRVSATTLVEPPVSVPSTEPFVYAEPNATVSSTAFVTDWGVLLAGPDDTTGNVVRMAMQGLNGGQVYIEQINGASTSFGSFAIRCRGGGGMTRAYLLDGQALRMTIDYAISGTIAKIPNHADDAAAAAGAVPVGGVYRNGSVLMIRVA